MNIKRKTKTEQNQKVMMQKTTNKIQNDDDDLVFEMDAEVIEDLEKQLENNNTIFKFPDGDTVFLLLPPKASYRVPGNLPIAVTASHYLGDLEQGLGIAFPEDLSKMQTCAKKHGESRCAWCEWMNDLKASTSRAHKKVGGSLYPVVQGYANIVDATPKDMDRWRVHIARIPKTIFEPLLVQMRFGTTLHHPAGLLQIHVKRTKSGNKISYQSPQILHGRKPIPFQDEWKELMQNPMEKIHLPMPYDEAKQWISDLTGGGPSLDTDYTNY